MWVKLEEYQEEWLSHGSVLRFPAKYPYEDVVDFMVFEPMPFEDAMGFMVVTGFKAGFVAQLVPLNVMLESNLRSFNKVWLVENWKKWVYPFCSPSDVYVKKNYDPPIKL